MGVAGVSLQPLPMGHIPDVMPCLFPAVKWVAVTELLQSTWRSGAS